MYWGFKSVNFPLLCQYKILEHKPPPEKLLGMDHSGTNNSRYCQIKREEPQKSPSCKHFLPIMPLKLFTMEGRDTFSKLQQIRKTANNLLPAVRNNIHRGHSSTTTTYHRSFLHFKSSTIEDFGEGTSPRDRKSRSTWRRR